MKLKYLYGLLASVGLLLSIQALWMPVKAELGQYLLQRHWQQVLAGDPLSSPWPGADMQAIAKLEVPALGIEQLILAGQQGAHLAWAPGLVSAATPGLSDTVISAHRDSHFSFLKQLSIGDLVKLQTTEGEYQYKVTNTQIVDSRTKQLQLSTTTKRLILSTCYPFDSLQTGGPLRYLVSSEKINEGQSKVPE